jgi:hypothetical protein
VIKQDKLLENTDINLCLQQLQTNSSTQEKEDLQQKLEVYINELINQNFNGLLQLLYRVDVNEQKLKTALQQHADKNSSSVIAALIIERQLQKITAKKEYVPPSSTDKEERW